MLAEAVVGVIAIYLRILGHLTLDSDYAGSDPTSLPQETGGMVMKKLSLIAGVVIGVLGLVVSANAIERHLAASDTARSLQTIESGMDWDGETPITAVEQADRMDANVDVWRSQKSQRNTSGLLGLLLLGGGVTAAVAGPRLARRS